MQVTIPVSSASTAGVSTVKPPKTVARIAQKNPHVANLPAVFRLPDHVEVTNADLQGHAIVQLFGFVGIPASTIPAMLKNQPVYWTGVAIGAVAALVCEFASTSHLNPRFKDYLKWWTRSASMNSLSKALLGGAHVVGISANTFVNVSVQPNNEFYTLFQGAIAGSMVAGQAIKLAMSITQDLAFSSGSGGAANSGAAAAGSAQDTVIDMQGAGGVDSAGGAGTTGAVVVAPAGTVGNSAASPASTSPPTVGSVTPAPAPATASPGATQPLSIADTSSAPASAPTSGSAPTTTFTSATTSTAVSMSTSVAGTTSAITPTLTAGGATAPATVPPFTTAAAPNAGAGQSQEKAFLGDNDLAGI